MWYGVLVSATTKGQIQGTLIVMEIFHNFHYGDKYSHSDGNIHNFDCGGKYIRLNM